MATNKRTYINADEELIIQGKLTIEGEMEQRHYTTETRIDNTIFEGETLIINSDGISPDGTASNATIRMRSGIANADIKFDGNTLTVDGVDIGAPEQEIVANSLVANVISDRNITITNGTIVGATSISSTEFVGDLTGDVDGDVTGNLTGSVTGNLTGSVTGDVTGDLTGNVTGDVTGDVTGNLTGNVTGNVTGNLTGDVTGDVTGNVTGNADTSTTLQTARSFSLSGDITAIGVSFDGSASVDLVTSISAGSITNTEISSTAAISDTKLATISTAGKVENTATTATASNTNNSIVSRDSSGNFQANQITANITGQVSDISNHSTSNLSEGTNQYFTTSRARASISHSNVSGDGSIEYNSTTGVISYTGPNQNEANARIDAHLTGDDGIDYSSGSIAVDNTVVRTSGTQSIAGTKTFTGTVDLTGASATAYPQLQSDDSNNIATTSYVRTAVANLIDNAPAALDTLNELAAALNDDANIGGIVSNNTTRIGTLESRNINAGAGLTGGGDLSADRTLNIGAGTGITVNADTVEVDLTPFSTSDLSEGTNLYYTQSRFDTAFGNKNTGNLSEGSNLYYTTARANSAMDAYLTGGTGINYSASQIDLADTTVTAGTYGLANTTVTITLDAQGRSTAISENLIVIEASQVSDFQAQSRTEMDAYLTGGDGIDYASSTIDVDSTVVRTSGDQTIAGSKDFTESLIVPHTSNTANGSIYYNGTDFWGVVNGMPVKLTPSSDVGDVIDVGTGEIDIYAGFETQPLGNANVKIHGIKSLSSDAYTDLTESSNVITISANVSEFESLIHSSISVGGDLSYNGSGTISFTERTDAQVRGLLSGGTGINYNSTTGEISSTNDNFNSWIVETDSGSGSAETITSNERVTIQGGTNITVTNSGNVVTIINDNESDINSVGAGSGLTGGGVSGNVVLNVGAGTGVTVAADTVSIGQDVATTADVEFNSIKLSTSSTPAHEEGLVFYDTDNKALAVYNDEADVTLQVGQEEWIRVFNNSGDTISNGKPVYVVGAVNGIPSIELASANSEVEAYAVGLATHDISSNSEGYVTTRGLVRGLNTSGLTEGNRAHVGVTAGTLQTASPTYPYFSTDVGIVVDSDATDGIIYVDITHHVTETFRVTDDARVDGDMTVAGNLTVLGTQSVLSISSLAVSDSFIYTNSGDTIGVAGTDFTGSGLDDGVFTGHYEGTTTNKIYYVRIDGVGVGAGGVDTFEWSLDNFSTTEATDIDITGGDQSLEDGISIKFNATTGHTSGDVWDGSASPVNVDTGLVSNRNTGASGIGYTHMGMFFDVSDEKFKFFEAYAPEPDGDIDTGNSSFILGTVVAEDFEATTFTGDLTGDVSGTVSSISNHDTGDLSEGPNLYYTDARARAALSASGDLNYNSSTGEFSVITYTSSDFTSDFNSKSTSNLSEGLNLYYTDARARESLSGGTGITYNSSTGQISLTDTGYVTGVTAGSGLTGGGASGTVTLNVGAGTGITVNADTISVTSSHINGLIDSRVTQSFVNGLSVTSAFSNQVFVTEENTNASTQRIVFHGGDGSGNKALRHDDSLTYVPDTNTLTVGVLSASTSVNTDLVNVGTTLDISSDGTDSEITESGTGALWIKGTNILLADSTGATKYMTGIGSTGETSLFYGGSQKLKTTSVGVTVVGDVTATNFNGVASSAKYADLAEKYTADVDYLPGTVVVHGGDAEVTTTTKMEDTRVAGVISTDPAYMMNSEADGIYVALRGRVPCKVMGMVKKGDVLVTCEVAGHAIASPNPHMVPAASIIGKAVSDHYGHGPGIVEVLV